jgi:hypothetical protein
MIIVRCDMIIVRYADDFIIVIARGEPSRTMKHAEFNPSTDHGGGKRPQSGARTFRRVP